MRVAFIHDWLVGMRGGERCLEVLASVYPDSDIYTLFYKPEGVSAQLRGKRVIASIGNAVPKVHSIYRHLLPLYPLFAEDLSRKLERAHAAQPYDLVISVSHCAAKNVRVPPGVPHLCYCLTPMRYIWDQYDSYFAKKWYEPAVRVVARLLRRWDVAGASGVTHFVAISSFIAQRIQEYYRRDAAVSYPPIDTQLFAPPERGEGGAAHPDVQPYFICVQAFVPYKYTELIVAAFSQLPYRLILVGSGPEEARLRRLAGTNIEFRSNLSLSELRQLYAQATALVFAAEEDFGMTPVEIQAAGRPVIAFARGGVLETVRSGETGLFYHTRSEPALRTAVLEFMSRQQQFTAANCIAHAGTFGIERFVREFEDEVARVSAPVSRVRQLRQ